ncbi:MAG: hypothetical protein CMO55_14445 [Verrucomicrobiales bacterium]|nr:hypothetical protein [Verrucomicrobiales bacterium]
MTDAELVQRFYATDPTHEFLPFREQAHRFANWSREIGEPAEMKKQRFPFFSAISFCLIYAAIDFSLCHFTHLPAYICTPLKSTVVAIGVTVVILTFSGTRIVRRNRGESKKRRRRDTSQSTFPPST